MAEVLPLIVFPIGFSALPPMPKLRSKLPAMLAEIGGRFSGMLGANDTCRYYTYAERISISLCAKPRSSKASAISKMHQRAAALGTKGQAENGIANAVAIIQNL
jgi:hypothetical protein